jgi:hypothetical protein
MRYVPALRKLFGDLYYIKQENDSGYNIITFEESIERL